MARRFSRAPLVRGSKRQIVWLELQPSQTTIMSGAVLLASLNALELAMRPFTVLRTLVHLRVDSDQLVADEAQFGAIGMCIVTDQALAIGITAIPTPVFDADSDSWFFHQYYSSDFTFGSGIGFAKTSNSFTWESKGQRKVEDGFDLAVVAEFAAGVSNGFIITVAGRVLIKTH